MFMYVYICMYIYIYISQRKRLHGHPPHFPVCIMDRYDISFTELASQSVAKATKWYSAHSAVRV